MRKPIRDAGLIQFGPNLKPEKVVSYDEYNAGDGPQPVVCESREMLGVMPLPRSPRPQGPCPDTSV